jgi:hypothetical protein
MKYAFVSLAEPAYKYDGTVLGARIVQVEDVKHLVETDVLIWVDCADDTVPNQVYYDATTQTISPLPSPPPPADQPVTQGTQQL